MAVLGRNWLIPALGKCAAADVIQDLFGNVFAIPTDVESWSKAVGTNGVSILVRLFPRTARSGTA